MSFFRNITEVAEIEPQSLWHISADGQYFVLVDEDQYISVPAASNIQNFEPCIPTPSPDK